MTNDSNLENVIHSPSRLEALDSYALLDTTPEDAFDDLTRLAAHVCETPIALISLVDDERQFFKSRVGLELTGTPNDISFCKYALTEKNLFVVPDARLDPRFSGNSNVVGEPRICFYAGAPLINREGHVLGTLCVIDQEARTLTVAQEQILLLLSRQIMLQFELRRRVRQLKHREEELLQRIAGNIQTENAAP